jgi:hypothetical protein
MAPLPLSKVSALRFRAALPPSPLTILGCVRTSRTQDNQSFVRHTDHNPVIGSDGIYITIKNTILLLAYTGG